MTETPLGAPRHPTHPLWRAELASNPTFQSCAGAELDSLLARAELVAFPSDAQVLAEGAPVEHLHLLLSGTVRVYHAHADGRSLTVKHLSAPCTFVEMEILAGEPCVLESVAALCDSRIVKVPKDDFLAFLSRAPHAAVPLLHDVCARFCTAARNERAAFYEAAPRFASLLLSYADLFGRPHPKGIRIARALTQDDIALGLGITARSVARTWASWQKAGWVCRSRGWIVLCKAEALEALCHGLRHNINYRAE
jgi:CRP/FNR family transcriptional regulator, cyclic AMP receptor protein